MKRLKTLFSFLAIMGILVCVNGNHPQKHQEVSSMKLIHQKTGFVVAEFQGEKTVIHDRMLEKEMTARGVLIPPPMRAEFGGKEAVRLTDKQFQKAFKELYSPQAFNPKSYTWEE